MVALLRKNGIKSNTFPFTFFIEPKTYSIRNVTNTGSIFAVSIGWLFYKFELNALEVPIVFVVFYDQQHPQGHSFFYP